MTERLALYAAAEADVRAFLGLSRRDPRGAVAAIDRVALFAGDEPDAEPPVATVLAELAAGRVERGTPPDAAWRALEAVVAAASLADALLDEMAVAADLEAASAAAGVPEHLRPLARTHHPDLGLPEPAYVYTAVVQHAAALAFAQACRRTDAAELAAVREFAERFEAATARAAELGRPAPDLWLCAPGHARSWRRDDAAPWPPTEAVDAGAVAPELLALAAELRD